MPAFYGFMGKTAGGGTTGDVALTEALEMDGQDIVDSNDNELITFTETASAVNHVNITNAATLGNPQIAAAGDDANIELTLQGKGTGDVVIGANDLQLDLDRKLHLRDPDGASTTYIEQTGAGIFGIHVNGADRLTYNPGVGTWTVDATKFTCDSGTAFTAKTTASFEGILNITETAAPGTPAANNASLWLDSTTNGWHVKYDSGTEHQFLTSDGYLNLGSARRLVLDTDGDTYIVSPSLNNLDIYAGGGQIMDYAGGTGNMTFGSASGTVTIPGGLTATDRFRANGLFARTIHSNIS